METRISIADSIVAKAWKQIFGELEMETSMKDPQPNMLFNSDILM